MTMASPQTADPSRQKVGDGQKSPGTRQTPEQADASNTRELSGTSSTERPADNSTTGRPSSNTSAEKPPSNRNTDKPQGNAGIETPPSNTGTERPHGSAGGIKASADTRNTQRPPDGKDDGTSRGNDTATEGSVRNQAENEQPRCNQTAPSLTSAKPSDRALRFVTIPQTHVDTMPPFYDGDHVSERMASVRKSIDYIRRHWDQYDSFMQLLQHLLRNKMEDFKVNEPELLGHMKSLFSIKNEWREKGSEVGDDPFDAIRVYTSPLGYQSFFSVINGLFRKDDSTQHDDVIRAAVFLVELLNIDLHNYCLQYPAHRDFQGEVYRGVSLSEDDFLKFRALLDRPIDKRYISIPLGLVSSSVDRSQAEGFLSLQSDKAARLMLMKIHVIGLDEEHLAFYRRKFPGSVVTSICAVDIHKLSCIQYEREVLLRGPFFQVLQLHEGGELLSGRPSEVLEMVMLNSNRNHLTSVQMQEEQQEAARRLFGTMVTVTRCQFCVRYCRDHGLVEDEAEYRRLLGEKRKELAAVMSHEE